MKRIKTVSNIKLPKGKVEIGIFQENSLRTNFNRNNNINNIELAYIHNYGSLQRNIPPRPFLTKDIIEVEKDKIIETINKNINNKNLLQKAGHTVLNIIKNIFATNGRGKWIPLKITRENNLILQLTKQMIKSIKVKVIDS